MKEISKFLNSIDACARKKQIEVIEEIKEIEQFQVRRAETEIIDDARRLIQAELASVKNRVLREISQENKKNKRKIFKKNNEIKQKILIECENEVKEFALSVEYEEKMKLIAKKMLEILGFGLEIFLKTEDMKYSNVFINTIKDAKISESKKIKLGGAVGRKGAKTVDLTFDLMISNFFGSEFV